MVERNEIDRIFGSDVRDADGDKIGTAGQVYVDDETGEPAWVTVRTGLFGTRESFVPLAEAYFSEHGLTVPFDKGFIKDAPNQDADGHLTPAEERDLYAYYGTGDATDAGRRPDHDPDWERDDDGPATAPVREADRHSDDRTIGDQSEHTEGRELPGPTTDDSRTGSEDHTDAGSEQRGTGRLRLRKVVVTENVTVSVPVQREEVRVEEEPISGGDLREDRVVADSGMTGTAGPARGNEGDDR